MAIVAPTTGSMYNTSDDISGYIINNGSKEANFMNSAKKLLANGFNTIFGIPYQFSEIVDKRLDDTSIGAKYAEKIVAKMPLLFMQPCKQLFMPDFSSDEQNNILNTLVTGQGSGVLTSTGLYYTTSLDIPDYYKHVNNMCKVVAYFLGIQNTYIPGFESKVCDINWADNAAYKSAKDIFKAGSNASVYYVDGLDSMQESFGNSTMESSIANMINGYSDQAKEIKFLLGDAAAVDVITDLAETAEGAFSSTLSGLSSNLLGGLLTDLGSRGIHTVLNGGKIIFPKLWEDSTFDRSYSFDIKLRSPDNDNLSIFFNIFVPYIHLLCMVLPQGFDDGNPNAYMTPFLCKAYCKGMFNIDMGLITSLSVTRGATAQWNDNGLPTQMDISLTIEDLYSELYLTYGESDPRHVLKNTFMMDFLANMAGINIADTAADRTVKLAGYLVSTVPSNAVNTIWNYFDGGIAGLARRAYSKLNLRP